MPETKKLYFIQYLRGLCAFVVFAMHTQPWLSNIYGINIGRLLFKYGGYGVHIFFIISGFIMVYTYKKKSSENTFKEAYSFIIRRIIRIVPLYIFLTILFIILFRDFSYFTQWSKLAKVIKCILFIPYNDYPVVLVGWSLNYEMFFYILFSISIVFGRYRIFCLMFLYLLLLISQNFHFQNSYLKMVSDPLNNFFFIGVILGIISSKIKIFQQAPIFLFLLSLITYGLVFLGIIKFNSQYALLIPLTTIFIGFLSMDLSKYGKIFIKPLYILGNISYSFYLLHTIIVDIFIRYIKIDETEIESSLVKLLAYIFLTFVIILVSYISYNVFEKKLYKKLQTIFL